MTLARCIFSLAFVASLVAAQPSFAKRAAPVPVAPLVVGETTFRVAHSPLGLVEAVDTKSGNPLWTKQIYVTRYDPALERDVQDRFITGLRAEDGGIIVTVEGGGEYLLNRGSLEVTRREAQPKSETQSKPEALPKRDTLPRAKASPKAGS